MKKTIKYKYTYTFDHGWECQHCRVPLSDCFPLSERVCNFNRGNNVPVCYSCENCMKKTEFGYICHMHEKKESEKKSKKETSTNHVYKESDLFDLTEHHKQLMARIDFRESIKNAGPMIQKL